MSKREMEVGNKKGTGYVFLNGHSRNPKTVWGFALNTRCRWGSIIWAIFGGARSEPRNFHPLNLHGICNIHTDYSRTPDTRTKEEGGELMGKKRKQKEYPWSVAILIMLVILFFIFLYLTYMSGQT